MPEGGGATPVYVTMAFVDIDEVDSAQQNFTANMFMMIRWNDPRLAHEGPGNIVIPDLDAWHPDIQFVNQQKIWPTLPEVLHIAPSGEVLYKQRVWGPFSQPLNVRNFPFDSQRFEVRLASVEQSPDEIDFQKDPDVPSGLAPEFSLPDWEILGWDLDFSPYRPLALGQELASCSIALEAKRYVAPYLYKVILPLVLIVAMSWIVFWVNPKESSTQINVATTSMLTLIAYRFMVGGELPAVPYLTRLDEFILSSTLLVFAALMQAVITSIMANQDRISWALWADRVCRLLFPVAFFVLTYYALFTPQVMPPH